MHGTHRARLPAPAGSLPDGSIERRLSVDSVSRVEGEGSLRVTVRGGEVVQARLDIFEAPRFFERLVVGRTGNEVLDIVARICGICPVAYQMTAVHAFESLFGVEVDPQVRALRRLLYCGEWLQSHALHVYLLHAPDFLGYPSAVHLARDHRAVVERGLAIKRAGNRLLALLGGRAIHPVSVRLGGFSRVPTRRELAAFVPVLGEALAGAVETVRWASGLPFPVLDHAPELLALRHPAEYPMNEGRITSSDGLDLPSSAWDTAFVEEQREGSTALVAHTRDGRHYLVGPTARVVLAGDTLHPLASAELRAAGGADLIRASIFRSIVARSVELVHAAAEALEIADAYRPPDRPSEQWTPRAGVAAWSTEAPRGLLFHRYEVDDRGLVQRATIVPPTSQNQAAIEDDLRAFLPSVLRLPDAEATERLESIIRSYDPCISCATHFLDVRVVEYRA